MVCSSVILLQVSNASLAVQAKSATLFDAQPGLPLLLSMRYSSEQLFYRAIVHPFERLSQFMLARVFM